MDLADKVAVITAGAGGIGSACAQALSGAGAHLVIADVDDHGAMATVERISQSGGRAIAVHCDVTSVDDLARLRAETVAEFGRVDLLHNHAGVGISGPPDQIPLSEWERVLRFNVMSQVRGVMEFVEELKATRGHLVNTTSSLGVASGHPIASQAIPYITSKAAIVGLTQSLALWLKPYGVGVSLLAPDHTETNFDRTVALFSAETHAGDGAAAIAEHVPYPIQQPEEIARIYLDGLRDDRFLLSSTPKIEDKLRRQAQALLDPFALLGSYAAPPAEASPTDHASTS